jgi:NADH-quinone oxidoreductase subunit N
MAISANSALGTQAMLFYVASYAFMVAGSFGVVSLVSGRGERRTSLSDYRGLSRSNPLLAGTFVVFLLAQAGIPFTSGFFAKLYAIDAADTAHLYWLALVAMLSAVVAAALYLRVIVAMYMTGDADEDPAVGRVPVSIGARIALGLCVLVTLGVGIFPEVLVDPAQHGVPVLVEPPAPTPPPAGTGEPSSSSTTSTTLATSLSGQLPSSGG